MNKRFHIFFILPTLVSLILLLNNYSQSQTWTYAGSVPDPGIRPSISVVSSVVVWIADGTVDTPKVFRTLNGGVNWTSISAAGLGKEVYCLWAISDVSAFVGEGVVTGNARLFFTNTSGANWTVVGQTAPNQGFFNGMVFSRKDTTYGFALAERIFKTTNSGLTWIEMQSGLNGVSNAHNSLFMVDRDFFGFGMNNGAARLRMTTDGGNGWFNQTVNVSGNYTCAVAFHDNKLFGVAATSTSLPLIGRTVDGGQTWSTINVDTGATGTCKIKWVKNSSVVYLMGENGRIKRSLDNGITWSNMQAAGVTDLYHFDFTRIANVIYGYAVSKNGTVIKLIDSILLVGTGELKSKIPSEYKLYQNYPNPFNPVTVIGFDLPKPTFTKLIIYDVLGRETETLVGEELNAGYHEFTWDASGFASGVYYFKIITDGFTDAKKMILTK